MRKIILITAISLLTLSAFSQTGTGWVQQRVKNNFRDSAYFHKDANFNGTLRVGEGNIHIGGTAIAPSAIEINILNGLLSSTTELNRLVGATSNVQTQLDGKAPLANPNFTTAVRLAGDSLMTKTRTEAISAAAVETRVASARNLGDYAFLKSTADAPGGAMTYEGVVNYVAANGGTGGGYEWTSFIVGTTTGAPTNGDTSITISQMSGDIIELYRGTTSDLHEQWLNETATNVKTGYRYNSSGTIVVRPAWATDDRAYIKAIPTSGVSKITLTGGESTLLTGLRAGWQLNEVSGNQVNDVLSTYTGSTTGSVNQPGKFGVAELFVRASAQWANMGQSVQDVGTSDFAMAAWFNISTSPGATAGIAGCVYDLPYYYMGINSEDHAYAIINFGSGNIVLEGSVALSASTWYHMILNVDRSGNATLHVDGSLVDTEDVSAGVAVNMVNNNAFAIGAIGDIPGYTWNGSIDDVYIWTKVLSGDEIATLQTKTYPWN